MKTHLVVADSTTIDAILSHVEHVGSPHFTHINLPRSEFRTAHGDVWLLRTGDQPATDKADVWYVAGVQPNGWVQPLQSAYHLLGFETVDSPSKD